MKKPFLPIDLQNVSLNPQKIDIYAFPIDTPLPSCGTTVLDNEEKTRAARFHFPHHRHHFKRARILLRLILAHYLKVPPNTLQFGYGEHGKPYLSDYPELQFNLSHSGTHALVAVGHTYPLGIDIERFAERPYVGIGSHVFSDIENEQLKALPNALKPLMFFNTWAQKEAFIKLLGLGLAYPTTKLTVPGLIYTAHEFLDPIYKENWVLLPFMPRLSYAAAVCYHPSIKAIHFTHLTDEL